MNRPEQSPRLAGLALLNNAKYNKSTAFTAAERDRYKLRGLLPAAISTQGTQITRVLENLRRKAYDIERYVFLLALQRDLDLVTVRCRPAKDCNHDVLSSNGPH